MAKPLVVSIPHDLGKEEAVRRLKSGLGRLRASFGNSVSVVEETWTGDHLDFSWRVLGQGASGGLDVAEEHVRIEVQLPWLLAKLGEKITGTIRQHGQILLEKK
jgi:hypothetical protein